MTQTVTVYGASDDLAEIEGDFYDEFDADNSAEGRWVFSTGTQISMTMNNRGDWVLDNVTPASVTNADEITFGRRPGYDRDGACTVTGDFTEVLWFKNAPKSARPVQR